MNGGIDVRLLESSNVGRRYGEEDFSIGFGLGEDAEDEAQVPIGRW